MVTSVRSSQKPSSVTECSGVSTPNPGDLHFPYSSGYCSHRTIASSICAALLPIGKVPPGTYTITIPSTGRVRVSSRLTGCTDSGISAARTVIHVSGANLACSGIGPWSIRTFAQSSARSAGQWATTSKLGGPI